MSEEGESKVQAVKRLALSGKFDECAEMFGAKAAAKARDYVSILLYLTFYYQRITFSSYVFCCIHLVCCRFKEK